MIVIISEVTKNVLGLSVYLAHGPELKEDNELDIKKTID